jgi:hypothetical protein
MIRRTKTASISAPEEGEELKNKGLHRWSDGIAKLAFMLCALVATIGMLRMVDVQNSRSWNDSPIINRLYLAT